MPQSRMFIGSAEAEAALETQQQRLGREAELPEIQRDRQSPLAGASGDLLKLLLDEAGVKPSQQPAVRQALAGLGAGEPISKSVAQRMGQRFGMDLSTVRIHADSGGASVANLLDAHAVTFGNHILFDQGAYKPGSPKGDDLLAHELAHVAQQRGGMRSGAPGAGNVTSDEKEADEAGARAAAGKQADVSQKSAPGLRKKGKSEGKTEAKPDPAATMAALAEAARKWAEGIKVDEREPRTMKELVKLLPEDLNNAEKIGAADTAVLTGFFAANWSTARHAWINRMKDPFSVIKEFQRGLGKCGDKHASLDRKIGEVLAEKHFEDGVSGDDLKRQYWQKVVEALKPLPPTDRGLLLFEGGDASRGVMADVAKDPANKLQRRGKVLPQKLWDGLGAEAKQGAKDFPETMLERAANLVTFWGRNIPADFHQKKYIKPFLATIPDTNPKKKDLAAQATGTRSDLHQIARYLWYRDCIKDASNQQAHLPSKFSGELTGSGGTNWFSPSLLDIKPGSSKNWAAAGFTSIARHVGLFRTWYQEGLVAFRMEQKEVTREHFRKPTAFDGMLSDLWKPADDKEYGITGPGGEGVGGGAIELVAGQIPAEKLKPSTVQIIPVNLAKGGEPQGHLMASLLSIQKKYGVSVTGLGASEDFLVTTLKVNPEFDLVIKDKSKKEHKFDSPDIKKPGFQATSVKLTLKNRGEPEIASGMMLGNLDLEQQFQNKNAKMPIGPGGEGGLVENKIPGDKKAFKIPGFIKELSQEFKMTDDGIAGVVSATAASSALPKIEFTGSAEVGYGDSGLHVIGSLGMKHTDGLFDGKVTLTYKSGKWEVVGELEVGGIKGVKPFTAKVTYKDGNVTFGVDKVEIDLPDAPMVKFDASLENMSYDVKKAAFSGAVQINARIEALGTGHARATIKNNKLDEVELGFKSKDLSYPTGEGKEPYLKGTWDGAVKFGPKGFKGAKIGGDVTFERKGLNDGNPAKLRAELRINEKGSLGGTVKLSAAFKLNSYLTLTSMQVNFDENTGKASGKAAMRLTGIRGSDSVEIECVVDDKGFRLTKVEPTISFGKEGETRLWGTLTLKWTEQGGFEFKGKGTFKIKDGVYASATIEYKHDNKKLSVKLALEPVSLLKFKGERKFLEFEKQIIVFSLYQIVGLYLEVGFSLKFAYNIDLKAGASAEVKGLDLKTMEYDELGLEVKLTGPMEAGLIGVPGIGLGAFVLHPKILRAGGGLEMEIAAMAKGKPTGVFKMTYDKEGNIKTGAALGLSLSFGINGRVYPYLSYSVGNGVNEGKWKGSDLGKFVIMEPFELFSMNLELGDLKAQDPSKAIPPAGKTKKPTPPAGDPLPTEQPKKKLSSAGGKGLDESKQGGPVGETATKTGPDQGGFDSPSLIDKLMASPKLAWLKKIIGTAARIYKKAKELYDQVVGFIGGVLDWFSADDKARAIVRKNLHVEMPAKARGKLISVMLSGWTGEGDEEAIVKILQFSERNGDLRTVLRYSGGGSVSKSADWILSDLDGREDSISRSIFKRNGIDW